MRLAIVTDACLPQTNGVVRTLSVTASRLLQAGHSPAPNTRASRNNSGRVPRYRWR